jgi:hypothetical protein
MAFASRDQMVASRSSYKMHVAGFLAVLAPILGFTCSWIQVDGVLAREAGASDKKIELRGSTTLIARQASTLTTPAQASAFLAEPDASQMVTGTAAPGFAASMVETSGHSPSVAAAPVMSAASRVDPAAAVSGAQPLLSMPLRAASVTQAARPALAARATAAQGPSAATPGSVWTVASSPAFASKTQSDAQKPERATTVAATLEPTSGTVLKAALMSPASSAPGSVVASPEQARFAPVMRASSALASRRLVATAMLQPALAQASEKAMSAIEGRAEGLHMLRTGFVASATRAEAIHASIARQPHTFAAIPMRVNRHQHLPRY